MLIFLKMQMGRKLILNYHHILPNDQILRNVFYGYTHSVSSFDAHLQVLSRQFMFTLDFDDASKISITFDDGSKSVITYAKSILDRYNLKAWFFINGLKNDELFWFDWWYAWFSYAPYGTYHSPYYSFTISSKTDRVSASDNCFRYLVGNYDQKESLMNFLTEKFDPIDILQAQASDDRLIRMTDDEVLRLKSEGHPIAYHSKSHEILQGLSANDLLSEITPSEATMRLLSHNGAFAIPFGFDGTYNEKVLESCIEAGYNQILLNTSISNKPGRYGRINLPDSPNPADIYFALAFS
jgi:peptidoglycan/xylan/chitin deacetylase (PgdA/CDA1 family)